jgi:hypothetical protein
MSIAFIVSGRADVSWGLRKTLVGEVAFLSVVTLSASGASNGNYCLQQMRVDHRNSFCSNLKTLRRREGAQGESVFVERRAIKNVRIHTAAITALTTVGKYLVSGGADGYVRFFDSRLRLAAWFEEMYAGGCELARFVQHARKRWRAFCLIPGAAILGVDRTGPRILIREFPLYEGICVEQSADEPASM